MSVLSDGRFQTSVYIKPTDKGIYPNFHSHIPEQYKKSVVNSLVTRAFKHSSTEHILQAELSRIKQILANNGYPQALIDKAIRSKRASNHQTSANDESSDPIKFFVQLYNLSSFKTDKKRLNHIIRSHVQPINPNSSVSVVPYYKPNKISSLFSTRVRAENTDRSNVVYNFTCNEDACSASYIGYTAQTLVNRIKQHRYKSSSICKHYMHDHDKLPPPLSEFKNSFKIIFSAEHVVNLKIVEAILIKSEKPIINIKFNELYDLLQLY